MRERRTTMTASGAGLDCFGRLVFHNSPDTIIGAVPPTLRTPVLAHENISHFTHQLLVELAATAKGCS